MTFARDIQFVCMAALALLLLYTLWLSRYRGLDTHVTVRWVLVQCVAILAIALWKWLPIFEFTSQLQDRQLLLVMTVLIFAFAAFLMLDLLVRLSRQSVQMKKLVQELAIQKLRLDAVAPQEMPPSAAEAVVKTAEPKAPFAMSRPSVSQVLFSLWLISLLALNGILLNEPVAKWVVSKAWPSNKLEATLKPFFTAAYRD